jgi:hypothetical protein
MSAWVALAGDEHIFYSEEVVLMSLHLNELASRGMAMPIAIDTAILMNSYHEAFLVLSKSVGMAVIA